MADVVDAKAVTPTPFPVQAGPGTFDTFPDRLKATAGKQELLEKPSEPLAMPEVVWHGKATKLELPAKLKGLKEARAIHVVGSDIVVADTGKSRVLLLNDEAEPKGAVLLEGCGKEEGADLLRAMDAVPYGSGLLVMDTGRSRVCWMPDRCKSDAQPATIFQPGGTHRPGAKLEGLKFPRSIAATPRGVWICDAWSHRLVRVPLTLDQLSAPSSEVQEALHASAVTAVGGPEAKGTTLKFPHSLAVASSDAAREVVFVSDANNHRVLRVTWRLPAAGELDGLEGELADGDAGLESVDVVYGTGQPGGAAGELSGPSGLAYDAQAKALYIADKDNARVLKLVDGTATAVYGSPQPVGVALRARGGKQELLVTDLLSDHIAVVEL